MLNAILALICAIGFQAGRAAGGELATSDGLTLRLDDTGAVTSCRIDGREVLRAGGRGGFFVADVGGTLTEDREVLTNPSFEQMERGKPVGWSVGGDWSVDHEVSHSGKASMKVHIPGPEKRSSGALAVDVPVQPNTPYRVSMWLRTEGGAPHFYIVQMDAQGRGHRDYPQKSISHARRHSDWFELSHSFTTAFFCRKIRVYTRLWQQTGTAWIDDVSLVCLEDDYVSPQRLAMGRTRQTNDGFEQACELADLALRLKARYKATPDYVVVDAEVEDTSGKDRAVTVSFRLPIDALGWTWFNDIHNLQTIERGIRYGAGRVLTERKLIALYPFGALGDARSALAFAVPMDMPRVFRICYEHDLGYFVKYEFALTRAAKKFPGKAWFRFLIYEADASWGFRSAAKRYYDFFPGFFAKRVTREGSPGSMVDTERIESLDYVAPAFSDFNWHRRQATDAHRRELVTLLQYTEFIGWWGWALGIKREQAEKKPTPEEAFAHVEKLAHGDPPHKVARCILNCVPHDRDGKRRLHSSYVPKWGGYNYLCNPDPEIEGIGERLNRFTLTYDREVARVPRYSLDGMRFDNPIVFAVDNFRREHFQWADHPLAFDHISKKPVMPLDFSSFECAKAIADDMHGRGKLVGSNYTPTHFPSDMFRIQFLDIIGSETLWTWCTHAKFALQRTLAYQKTVSMCWQEAKKDWAPERIEREMKQAMFYGTHYYLSTMGPQLYDRWVPLTRRLAHAGWEPITHAHCEGLGPMVERFGSFASRNLHFTLRNETKNARTVELTIDAHTLGLNIEPRPDVWVMRDSWTHEKMGAERRGERWMVKLALPAKDTIVLRVATNLGLALDHLFLVPDGLRKAANYCQALEHAGARLECPAYEQIGRQSEEIAALLRLKRCDFNSIRAQLQALADALAEPVVRGDVQAQKTWVAKLKDNSAKARSGIAGAISSLRNPAITPGKE